MYAFAIIGGLSLLIGAFLGLKEGNRVSTFLGAIFGILIGVLVSLFFAIVLQRVCPKAWIDAGTQKIVAMRDGSQTEGSFFLWGGQLEGVDYFFCYGKTDNGGLVRVKFGANNTVVYEDASSPDDCRVETVKLVPKDGWREFVLPFDPPILSYAIHVPSGTVVRQFTADLR